MPKTYVKLASQTLTSNGTVTFTNIPQNYTDLVLTVDNALSTSSTPGVCLRFNGDSGTNYSGTWLEGYGTGSPAFNSYRVNNNTYTNSGYGIGLSVTANQQGACIYHIQNYSNTNVNKTTLVRYNQPLSNYPGTGVGVNVWRSTAAITSINVNAQGQNIASGAIFTLYGIECAKFPKATGGDQVYTDGTYWYHIFRNSGLFSPQTSITADYLVVAGGGGGSAGFPGSGGGAGGFRTSLTASTLSLVNGAYPVTIGAGGAGGLGGVTPAPGWNATAGRNGSDSVFSTITSTGGGCGVPPLSQGGTGGSGGGGGHYGGTAGPGNTPSTSPSQGNNGGAGTVSTPGQGGGGGGGAGAVGGSATGSSMGAGGNGVTTSISGTSTTYAGGGGAGAFNTVNAGAGGTGGGGTGGDLSSSRDGSHGTANLGGGGGGGGRDNVPNYGWGGNGGSGIVIVRYAV